MSEAATILLLTMITSVQKVSYFLLIYIRVRNAIFHSLDISNKTDSQETMTQSVEHAHSQ